MALRLRYSPSCSRWRSGEGTDCFQVFFAELVALLHREGKTASRFLQELYDRYVNIVRGTGDFANLVRYKIRVL